MKFLSHVKNLYAGSWRNSMPSNSVKYRGTPMFGETARLLIQTARSSGLINYAPIFEILGLKPGNNAAKEAGQLLGEISEETHKMGLPMLSALVVSTGKQRPGGGFYVLANWVGKIPADATEQQKEAFWREERDKVYAANWDRFEAQLD